MDQKPKMELVGHDGNIFSILGRAGRLLRQNGMAVQIQEMNNRVYGSHSYNEALNIISEYVETELSPTAKMKKNSRGQDDFER